MSIPEAARLVSSHTVGAVRCLSGPPDARRRGASFGLGWERWIILFCFCSRLPEHVHVHDLTEQQRAGVCAEEELSEVKRAAGQKLRIAMNASG